MRRNEYDNILQAKLCQLEGNLEEARRKFNNITTMSCKVIKKKVAHQLSRKSLYTHLTFVRDIQESGMSRQAIQLFFLSLYRWTWTLHQAVH